MRIIYILHKWIGLTIGLFIFISCFSGMTMLTGRVFECHSAFFNVMGGLHHNLFLGEVGRMILGISTLFLIVEIITGYIIWGKIAVGKVRQSRRHGTGGWKGFWESLSWIRPNVNQGLHTAGGFWCGVPLALMAATGLVWSFGWFKDLLLIICGNSGSGSFFSAVMSLHTGGWGEIPSRIIWIFMAALGASLPVTGLIITFRALKKHN